MDSGTLLDLMPPVIIVGVRVMRDRARIIEAKRGFSGSTSAMISSTFSADGLCSMAKTERWSKRLVDVSRSGSKASMRWKDALEGVEGVGALPGDGRMGADALYLDFDLKAAFFASAEQICETGLGSLWGCRRPR